MSEWIDRVYPCMLPLVLLLGVSAAVFIVWKNKRNMH